MAASIAVAILAFAAAVALISGLVLATQQFLFIAKSYRVLGKVASEWNYRLAGLQMRYYRVDFCLNNGQSAHLRSGVTSSSQHPKVGQTVPVLIRERSGTLKARIGTMKELWFEVFVLLFIGSVGGLLLLPLSSKVFAA
jgi:hypothetical protein